MANSAELFRLGLGNGDVTYVPKIDPKPETRTTETSPAANVTVVNAAVAGVPAHYQVSFMLQAELRSGNGVRFSNIFHLRCVVEETDHLAPYRMIEDQGARQLAPMLRSFADRIEADLPEFPPPDANPR